MKFQSSWLKVPPSSDPDAVALVTLPFAGAGASVFRPWQIGLPCVTVMTGELPGRESRRLEPPLMSLAPVIAQLADAVDAAVADRPFAVFGHSLGALLGFELLRERRRRGRAAPLCLFASGREAPTRRDPGTDLHDLPDDAFVAGMIERYDGIPQAILDEPELLDLFLPALKADLRLSETYRCENERPFDFPIHVLAGIDDHRLTADLLDPWAEQTTAACPRRSFAGGHFFIRESRAAVLDYVGRVLSGLAPAGSTPSRTVAA